MMWPRLMALAEVAWSRPGRKDYEAFRERVATRRVSLPERGLEKTDKDMR